MARGIIHEAVKKALIKDGWSITDDPFRIKLMEDNRNLEADLGAEKFFSAKKGTERIVIEIKTFSGASILNQFHGALGQYLVYRSALKEANINRELYLAISINTYDEIEEIRFLKKLIDQFDLKLIIVDLVDRTLLRWIK